MITTADKLLFRPSQLGDIMSGLKKGWDVENSITCKKTLIKIFRQIQNNRYYNHHNKYTEKGIAQEQDAITLISRVRKVRYEKNVERLTNEWFNGEPDIIYLPETIDAKCSWSLETFPHEKTYMVDDDYKYQGIGYNSLTGARRHIICYCLVNATPNLIDKEKKSLWYQMGCPNKEAYEFIFGCLEVERNMIFDMSQFRRNNPYYQTIYTNENWNYDIPFEQRLFDYPILFDEKIFKQITDRITECRQWMNDNLFKTKIIFPVS